MGCRRELAQADVRWGLDETSIFDHDSAKTCEGSQKRKVAPMGFAR